MSLFSTTDAAAGGAATVGYASGDRWQRHEVCREWDTPVLADVRFTGAFDEVIPDCTAGTFANQYPCPDGSAPLAPWWVSRASAGGGYAPWVQASSYQCTADVLALLAEQAWASMPIAPNTYTLEPATGWVIAELGVNIIIDTNPRTMQVTLLGIPVTIRAVPTVYTFTNTDGTTWTTTTPGKPYDHGGTPFTYPRTPEHRTQITLTTTWRGEYTTNGTTWAPAPGTATTTSTTMSLHVYNPHPHLVNCDLNGTCLDGGPAPTHPATLTDPDADGIDNYTIPDNQINDYLKERSQA